MPFQFQFPWLKNPAPSSTQNPNPSFPNPFLPIQAHLTSFLSSLPLPRALPPSWARIPSPSSSSPSPSAALPIAEIEERLSGVPVYALANSAQEFVLVSSAFGGEGRGGAAKQPAALGLLCLRREDADALLEQMDGDMRAGSTVVPVALNKAALVFLHLELFDHLMACLNGKVFHGNHLRRVYPECLEVIQLKSNGVAFRFVPDSSQVANAIKLMEDEGQFVNEGFPGVPVFQSRSLVLMSDNKRYRPVFFRKEDLDNSLYRASRDHQKPNPAIRIGDTQVSSLEDIIKSMKDSSSSKWDDAVFIPPGFDLATGAKTQHLNK